MQIVKIYICCI